MTADYAAIDYSGGGAGCASIFTVPGPTPPPGHTNNDPMIDLSLYDGTTQIPVAENLNPCTAPGNEDLVVQAPPGTTGTPAVTVRVARLAADPVLWTGGSSMGLSQYDAQPYGYWGNDGATDNIRIVDVTPQLDKSFSPKSIPVGGVSTLTLTVTNTSELGEKAGWSFSDALRPGLKIADDKASTNCADGTVQAPAGGTSLHVSGTLPQGTASCTVKVNVTAAAAGKYVNGPQNIFDDKGVNPPGRALLKVTTPSGPSAIMHTFVPVTG